MKEDLLMRRCKISDEIGDEELELQVPCMEYNFNNINRQIMLKPMIMPITVPERKKRNPFSSLRNSGGDNNVIEEEHKSNSRSFRDGSGSHGEHSSSLNDQNAQPKFKMVYTFKYITTYFNIIQEEEEKQEQSMLMPN